MGVKTTRSVVPVVRTTFSPFRALVLPIVVALLAAACGDGTVNATDGAATVVDLDGRQFWSTAVFESGEPRVLVEGTRITISFDGDDIGASAGCNSLGGGYLVDDGVVLVNDMAMTEIGCDPRRHDQDEFVAALLTARPSISLQGDHLVLTAGDTIIELLDRRVADPDRPIVATE